MDTNGACFACATASFKCDVFPCVQDVPCDVDGLMRFAL